MENIRFSGPLKGQFTQKSEIKMFAFICSVTLNLDGLFVRLLAIYAVEMSAFSPL